MSATDSASTVLAPGTQVPDFKLATESGEEFTQSNLQDKTTVLVFYPFAFSPVCTDQLQVYEQVTGRRSQLRALTSMASPATPAGLRKRFARSWV